MSTPEQPATPALTRKQLREIRNTGATPIVNGDGPPAEEPSVEPAPDAAAEATSDAAQEQAETSAAPEPEAAHVVAAPLPRAAEPAAVHDRPGADASVDLGVAPLTRRQARQQERIRTASVPVITPELSAAYAASVEASSSSSEQTEEAAVSGEVSPENVGADAAASATDDHSVNVDEAPLARDSVDVEPDHDDDADGAEPEAPSEASDSGSADDGEPSPDEAERAIVNPRFGAELLAGEAAVVDLPPSFGQLISRSATGSVGTGSALILSQTPSASPLVAPVTATGEVLITGSFDLPEGLGSTGHAPGVADGKEVDAVLVDGELPAHSSPTPIAASAAISTVKSGDDIIKPPAPEKGGRLMLTLAITAGVLALALVGVLILAFVTGVF